MPHDDLPEDYVFVRNPAPGEPSNPTRAPSAAVEPIALAAVTVPDLASPTDIERDQIAEDALDELFCETLTAVLMTKGTPLEQETLRRRAWLAEKGAMHPDERRRKREAARIETGIRSRVLEALKAYSDHDWARREIADIVVPIILKEKLG